MKLCGKCDFRKTYTRKWLNSQRKYLQCEVSSALTLSMQSKRHIAKVQRRLIFILPSRENVFRNIFSWKTLTSWVRHHTKPRPKYVRCRNRLQLTRAAGKGGRGRACRNQIRKSDQLAGGLMGQQQDTSNPREVFVPKTMYFTFCCLHSRPSLLISLWGNSKHTLQRILFSVQMTGSLAHLAYKAILEKKPFHLYYYTIYNVVSPFAVENTRK